MIQRHTDVLAGTVALEGRRVLEVGCGGGRLLRWLTGRASFVAGVDPSSEQIRHARGHAPLAGLTLGRAEALPFASDTFDLVLFFNSLHHVDPARQPMALVEAARALAPGGDLLVVEPDPSGAWFELLRPIEDETEVRERTQAFLGDAGRYGVELVGKRRYDSVVVERDAAGALSRLLAANAGRRERAEALRDDLEAAFARLGRPSAEGMTFVQPMRLHHLRERA